MIIFLLINSLSGYFIERRHIDTILKGFDITSIQNLMIFGTHDLAIICSGLMAAWLLTKIKRSVVLYFWMALETVSSVLIYFTPNLSVAYIQVISIFWGITFGLGMPSCLAYFSELTDFENRGLVSGVVFSLASAIAPLLLIAITVSFAVSASISIAWKVIGLLTLTLLREKSTEKEFKHISFKQVLSDRQFLLYVIPWFMFSCIYGFQRVTLEHAVDANIYELLRMLQSIFGAISAFVSGILCGKLGRKKVIIYGFISLGIAYALIGIFSASLTSLYFYSVNDGIAWGIFIVMFILVLCSDFSNLTMKRAEKYYAVGSAPFFLADFVGLISAIYVQISISAAFSVASFFLFLAVVPLIFASETLPERKIRERELKSYIEKAKKVREKFT